MSKTLPVIGSHEFAGTVVALGPNVQRPLKIGDRLGVPGRAFHACGTCDECKAGEKNYSVYCSNAQNLGLTVDGGFAQYALVDSLQVVSCPDGMPFTVCAPLMCAGTTIFGALQNCNLKSPSGTVAIMGCGGGLGHLGLMFAEKMDLHVLGVDNNDNTLELARSLNTRATIVDARTTSPEEALKLFGGAVDATIILPEAQAAFDYGAKLTKRHGMINMVSFPKRGFTVSPQDVVFRDIKIRGTLLADHGTMQRMLNFAADHQIKPVMKTFPLSQLNALVDEYNLGKGGKLVVDMSIS